MSVAKHEFIDLRSPDRLKHIGKNEYSVRLYKEGKAVDVSVTFTGRDSKRPARTSPPLNPVSDFQRATFSAQEISSRLIRSAASCRFWGHRTRSRRRTMPTVVRAWCAIPASGHPFPRKA